MSFLEEPMDNFFVRLLGGLLFIALFLGFAIMTLVMGWRNISRSGRPRLQVVRNMTQRRHTRSRSPLTTEEMSRFAALFHEEECAAVFSDLNQLMRVYFPHIEEEKKETKKRLQEVLAHIKRQEKKGLETERQFALKLYHTHRRLGITHEQCADELDAIESIAGSVKNHLFNTYMKSTRFDIRHQIGHLLRRLERKRSLHLSHKGETSEGEGG